MRVVFGLLVAAGLLTFFVPGPWDWRAGAAEAGRVAPVQAARGGDEAALLERKRQQLAEKEAALKEKEESLRKLSATLEARVVELNAAKKGIESALDAKRKQDIERYQKMIKIYKSLKAPQAGSLLNQLEEKTVIELLNHMDQKTVVKLIPFINQPKVLEWTRLNLKSGGTP